MLVKQIAVIRTGFKEKFGIPRQSGLIEEALGKIEFLSHVCPEEALRGIDQYSHLWIIWEFSANKKIEYSPTVRPPRLGGNTKVGVFATRSPYRPNPIGLSLVRLIKADIKGGALYVGGVDMLDGTPIIDIKPYIPYADRPENPLGGFAEEKKDYSLAVKNGDILNDYFSEEQKNLIIKVIKSDPRPSYQDDPDRVYGVKLFERDVRFKVFCGEAEITEVV